MNIIATTLFAGWPLLAIVLAMLLPARKAAALLVILPVLFLPEGVFYIPGYLYTKDAAIGVSALLALIFTHPRTILSYRLHWLDVPIILFCLAPLLSTLSNGLSVNDGIVPLIYRAQIWLAPFIIGRVFLSDKVGRDELLRSMFIGGLIYIPFCLYEIRMSPQLNAMFYGFIQHSFAQTRRGEGWRPMVFMQHGLMLSFWMCMTSLIGWVIARQKRYHDVWGIPIWPLVWILVATALLCKSTGASLLLVLGIGIYELCRTRPHKAFLYLLALSPIVYMGARISQEVSGETLVNVTKQMISEDRADSLQTRIASENDFIAAAKAKPIFGWRHWGYTEEYWSETRAIPDGLWTLELIENGFFGFVSLVLALTLAPLVFIWKLPPRSWLQPQMASGYLMGIVGMLYMYDCVANAMINPIYIVMLGALSGMLVGSSEKQPVLQLLKEGRSSKGRLNWRPA